jgi:hypothetical protein
MKKFIILLSVVALFACGNNSKKNKAAASSEEIQSKLIGMAVNELKQNLPDSTSYVGGNFIIETRLPNDAEILEYPFVVDTVYMSSHSFQIWGEDTVFNGRFYVYHIYKALDWYGETATSMIKLEFDSHLKYQGFEELTERAHHDALQKWSEMGQAVEPLAIGE